MRVVRLIKFGADWCGPCKALEPKLQEIEQRRGIEIERVNIDEAAELVLQYKILSIPTVLAVDENGAELGRVTAPRSSSQIEELLTL